MNLISFNFISNLEVIIKVFLLTTGNGHDRKINVINTNDDRSCNCRAVFMRGQCVLHGGSLALTRCQ